MSRYYLNRNCGHCGERLKASKHKIESERVKRDAKKVFCNTACWNAYEADNAIARGGVPAMDIFLYGAKL